MHLAIVGCGQLSQMIALSGASMGIKFSFVADAKEDICCVEGMGAIVRWQPGDCIEELYKALGQPDCITVEKEQVELSLIEQLQQYCPVRPNSGGFAACQHRHREKQLLDKLAIPCAAYIYGRPDAIERANLPLPVVVKSCRFGYDGKNQWVLRNQQDIDAFNLQAEEEHYIIEALIPFSKEISQVSVRSINGEIHHYPLTENQHSQGILVKSVAPAINISEIVAKKAQDYMRRIMENLDYIGVMAMECFVVEEKLLVNELAPRVHNSGHWTQAGSVTSQFENHLRAVCGLALGSTAIHGVAGMVNLIGTSRAPIELQTASARLHWYGKTVRAGRKLGHINIVDEDYDNLLQQMDSIQSNLKLSESFA